MLFSNVIKVSHELSANQLHWQVLDWNEPAIKFYKSLGGKFLDEWRTVRLSGSELRELADKTLG